jgi:hypothetical protein
MSKTKQPKQYDMPSIKAGLAEVSKVIKGKYINQVAVAEHIDPTVVRSNFKAALDDKSKCKLSTPAVAEAILNRCKEIITREKLDTAA